MPREELLAGYEAASGHPVSPAHLHFYEVLCAYKSTVATLGSSVRAAAAHHNHQDVLLSWLASCGYVFVDRLCDLIEEGPPVMNPSIDVRIDSMMRALADFVIPELPADGTAAEQAALVLGHLQVLREQVDVAGDFERFELTHSVREAEAVLAVTAGGDRTSAAAATLRDAVVEVDSSGAAATRRSTENVRGALEGVVTAVAEDGAVGSVAQVRRVVIAFERELATANRALFRGNGWETSDSAVPDITTLLDRA